MRLRWVVPVIVLSMPSSLLATPTAMPTPEAATAPATDAVPPATAGQIIDAFDNFCLATLGDPTEALKRARAAGYGEGTLSKSSLPLFSAIGGMTRLSIETADTKALFLVGRGPSIQFGRYQTRACALAVTPLPDAEFRTAWRAHLGVDPAKTDAAQDTYSFAVDGAGRRSVPTSDNAAVKAAIAAGTYRAVFVGTLGQNQPHPFDVLILLIPYDHNSQAPAAP